MKTFRIIAGLLGTAGAMPSFMNDPVALKSAREILSRRQVGTQDALGISKGETNCGQVNPAPQSQ